MRLAVLMLLLVASPAFALRDHLIVHEWGTFTALQDENGRAIGGININDEALPKFVHRIGPGLLSDSNGSKGIAIGHPDVTMRLETPVIYFYPSETTDEQFTLNVKATFVGGLLSEFYPKADTTFDGKPSTDVPGNITASTRGGLTWNNIALGGNVRLPVTNSHVWTSPRAVNSSPVTVGKEAEQYIFYRGVGHFDAPVRTMRSADGKWLSIYENRPGEVRREFVRPMPMWLAEFHADGSAAFRAITAPPAPAEAKAQAHPGTFADEEFSAQNVDKLRAAMKEALLAQGLFEDEADAMLETWKLSYFKTVGQRLFFLVPREWTDRVLPLEISHQCELTRVMVGRIELVTPEQSAAVARLTDPKAKLDPLTAKVLRASLGRFAEPLIQREYRNRAPAKAAAVD